MLVKMEKKPKMAHFFYGDSEEVKTARYSRNPKKLQELAIKSDSKEVHVSIACNHYTSPETLAILAESKHIIVRKRVAENENILFQTAFHLAYDASIKVRESLSRVTSYKSVQHILYEENRNNVVIITNVMRRTCSQSIIDSFLKVIEQNETLNETIGIPETVKILNEMLYNDSLNSTQLTKIIYVLKSLNVSLNVARILNHPSLNEKIATIITENSPKTEQ